MNMQKFYLILLLLLIPTMASAQEGFSLGIQSHYGAGRLSVESAASDLVVEPQSSFVTGASLFLQWNFTPRLGVRLQAGGMYQGMTVSVIQAGATRNVLSNSIYEDFGQGAVNLQFSYSQPLNADKTLSLEGFLGAGVRGASAGNVSCSSSFAGASTQAVDSIGELSLRSHTATNTGAQLELLGGVRVVQQVNRSDRKPIYLTIGASYRQTLSPLAEIEGLAFTEEVELTTDQFGFVQFPFDQFQDVCGSDEFEERPEDRFALQHLGQQVEMQIGVRFGL